MQRESASVAEMPKKVLRPELIPVAGDAERFEMKRHPSELVGFSELFLDFYAL